MAPPNPSTQLVKVEVQLPKNERQALDEIAYQQSEPGDLLDRSDILREAIRDYVQKARNDPQSVSPRERGGISPILEVEN